MVARLQHYRSRLHVANNAGIFNHRFRVLFHLVLDDCDKAADDEGGSWHPDVVEFFVLDHPSEFVADLLVQGLGHEFGYL